MNKSMDEQNPDTKSSETKPNGKDDLKSLPLEE